MSDALARSRRRAEVAGLRLFARLPRWARIRLVRLLKPSHTVGAVCLVEHEGAFLMLRQHHRPGWSFPGGLLDRGESAEAAAVRELIEETGLRAQLGLPVACIVDPGSQRVDVLFHVPVGHRPQVRVGSEAISAAWLRPEEADPVDVPTRQVLRTVVAGMQPGAHVGRLLDADAPAGR
ncbi:MAG: NUDIX hydrolase [Kineosporiaceae bacterium]